MKKIVFIITLSLSFAFIGCGDDDKTNLRWVNRSNDNINDIVWYGSNDLNNPHQIWDGNWGVLGATTDYKEIKQLNGEGEALVGGTEVELYLNSASSNATFTPGGKTASIKENTDATLVIQSTSL